MKCSNISRGTGTRIAALETAAYDSHAVVHYPPKPWADRVFGIDWARRSYRENMERRRLAIEPVSPIRRQPLKADNKWVQDSLFGIQHATLVFPAWLYKRSPDG